MANTNLFKDVRDLERSDHVIGIIDAGPKYYDRYTVVLADYTGCAVNASGKIVQSQEEISSRYIDAADDYDATDIDYEDVQKWVSFADVGGNLDRALVGYINSGYDDWIKSVESGRRILPTREEADSFDGRWSVNQRHDGNIFYGVSGAFYVKDDEHDDHGPFKTFAEAVRIPLAQSHDMPDANPDDVWGKAVGIIPDKPEDLDESLPSMTGGDLVVKYKLTPTQRVRKTSSLSGYDTKGAMNKLHAQATELAKKENWYSWRIVDKFGKLAYGDRITQNFKESKSLDESVSKSDITDFIHNLNETDKSLRKIHLARHHSPDAYKAWDDMRECMGKMGELSEDYQRAAINSNIISEGVRIGRHNETPERPKGDVNKLDAIQNKLERIIKEVTGLGIRQGGAGRYDYQEEIEVILRKVSNAIGYRAEEIEEYEYEMDGI